MAQRHIEVALSISPSEVNTPADYHLPFRKLNTPDQLGQKFNWGFYSGGTYMYMYTLLCTRPQ